MPVTRSQTEERNLVVFEDFPASPSAGASRSDTTRARATTSRTAATADRSGPAAPIMTDPFMIAPPACDAPATTEVPRHESSGPVRRSRPASVRSHNSTASAAARIRQAEFEAEEQLAAVRREELQIQARLIQKKLAANLAAIQDESDRESIGAEETENRVAHWLSRGERQTTDPVDTDKETRYRSWTRERSEPNAYGSKVTFEPTPIQQRHKSPIATREKERQRERGIDRLAEAIEKIALKRPPPRQTQDLPIFSGATNEWLPFKAAMQQSTSLHQFSPAENVQRLRSCLRGEAKQSVSALLYTAADPAIIMKTLEQCYGRPEMIIDNALEDMKKLPRLGNGASELNAFAIKLQNIVTVISCLDERNYLQNPMMARQITEKLSPHVRTRWCDYAEDFGHRSEPEIVTLSRFLMREADRAMRHSYTTVATRSAALTPRPTEPQTRGNRKTVLATTEAEPTKTEPSKAENVCFCCGAKHVTTECKKLTAMLVAQRWEWAKETKVCFRCLNSKHRRFTCKKKLCGVNECRRPHHALLHTEEAVTTEPAQNEESVVTATAHSSINTNRVLLKVCPITLKSANGSEVTTHALLDEGSTITLVDEEIAEMVGARGPKRSLHIIGATSSQRETDSRVIDIQIRGRGQTNYRPIRARTVKNLMLGSQSVGTELLRADHLRELSPEDVCYDQVRPRVLIGSDNWHLIVTRKLLTGTKSQPAASLCQLGWIIHGTAPRSAIKEHETGLHVYKCQTHDQNDDLDELVRAHFKIDALGVSLNKKPVAADERAKKIFASTVERVNNQFSVGLPWADDQVNLPPSYDMALRRLKSIERKMDKSPIFEETYTAEIMKLMEHGYAVPCEEEHDANPRLWYLPHFAVTNPQKPNKIRLVFDAAACSNGVSLNDALLDGPDLLQSLYGVLFRFRKKPIAVTADIRAMFLQIKIKPEDRVAQHFLWRGKERFGPPQKYMMTSMIFGARSSPFLAHSVRNKNATDHKDSHPLAYEAITQSHYMDDWVESFDSEEVAARAIKEVQEVHSKAGFELASWSSNRERLLTDIPNENRAHAPKELAANAHVYGKTLGILWMPGTDELAFNTTMPRVPNEVKQSIRIPTKREALSAVMSLFDPLGLLCPYTITAKMILQELWKKQVSWDEPLPLEEAEMYTQWLSDLKYIKNIRLARCYQGHEDVSDRKLHVFCDASEQAFAAVAYWRFVTPTGIKIMLVAGKAKVAPLKSQSIPRMELQAALVGARLATEIVKGHNWNTAVTLWSDSKTVLQWIRKDSAKYAPYVAHRLSEIGELTRSDQWRWVPTAHNVADDATRSGNTRLRTTDRWFTGPAFLYEPESSWPKEEKLESTEEEMLVTFTSDRTPLIEIERFSSYERLVRAVAYVLTFIDKCRHRTVKMELRHMQEAERLLIKEAQRDSFADDLQRLTKGKNVDRTSRLYKLDPRYGGDQLIRLNGRINAATVPNELKNPPILDGAHPIAHLIIRREHVRNRHIGREQTVNNLRQKYWILRLRPTVRTILRKCAMCAARRANPVAPVKGDLPLSRLTTHTRPFAHCGVDCFGPMWVTIGRRREKRWGMIFTCLVIRAIHIELIASLSTDSAIMAIRRMAARRGTPALIASDNGTNFRGSNEELKKAYNEWLPALKTYALTERIEWRFIDPGAPNQGGAWERMIKTVKNALSVTLTERAPKEETLSTLMTEIEHTVNSRPLTHVAVEPDEPEALTPNHFLLGTAAGLPYVGECSATDKRTWRAAQALANSFWARWIKEYLPTLAPRNDARKTRENLKIGDLVMIADGLLPRNVWPRGLVERVRAGPDGVVRSAEVRTRGGIFRRPVSRLVVLPVVNGYEGLRRGETVADNYLPN